MTRGRKRSPCTVDGCGKPMHSHGYCPSHLQRFRRHGNPLGGRKTYKGDGRAYFENVVLAYEDDDCLIWPFTRGGGGYAYLFDGGKSKRVARLVCERTQGPPRPGDEAAHSCGNGHEGCVSPAHLSWKNHDGNMKDMVKHGRSQRGEKSTSAKLTTGEVERIKGGLLTKMTQSEIARGHGVSRQAIHSIAKGHSWSWLPAFVAVVFLAGCATTPRDVTMQPMLAKIPQSLKQACAGVVRIPDRDLTEAEVARLWGKDRAALGACVKRHAALSAATSALEAQGQ